MNALDLLMADKTPQGIPKAKTTPNKTYAELLQEARSRGPITRDAAPTTAKPKMKGRGNSHKRDFYAEGRKRRELSVARRQVKTAGFKVYRPCKDCGRHVSQEARKLQKVAGTPQILAEMLCKKCLDKVRKNA